MPVRGDAGHAEADDRAGVAAQALTAVQAIRAWPLPSTPARPKISPLRTTRESPSTATVPRSSRTRSPSIARTGSPGLAVPRSTFRTTARPTIIEARSALVAPAGRVSPVTRPARMTTMRSLISRTSSSLWLMKMMDRLSAARERMMAKSSRASCGVSTAVGSSRIRMRAER